MSFFKKIFGTKHDRDIKKLRPIVDRVNSLGDAMAALDDASLKAKTGEFRGRLDQGASLDDILPEAFAVVREAAWRTLHMRHYDVQLVGGAVLHQGKIAEMKTGEGKTLVATLPLYLNGLSGKGCHLITVNDYLAERDAAWMGRIYKWLGLSVGCILRTLDNEARRAAYNSDITYGTNSEMGFDYLRDNMKLRLEDYVQRGHNFSIVDEVDSILIDEARTPLIISGQAEGTADRYLKIDAIIPRLQVELDYQLDLKAKSAHLTDQGVDKVQELLEIGNLFDPHNVETLHTLNQALRAHAVYRKDVEYVVRGDKVIIVDEFTGRQMPGRRWSDGLHQAIEAKERVPIEPENRTVATITYQNFFLLYDKLAGMTGTADTEAEEFQKIYNLDCVVIPTNRPILRGDHADLVYKTESEKFQAVAEEIERISAEGQPILVGTTSVEKSELLSRYLKRKGIAHEVLNAKNHGREAIIVAQAGRLGAVTIATNMAGRGTDILLGGNPEYLARERVGDELAEDSEEFQEALSVAKTECSAAKEKVLSLGGLHIIGTERHDSRRVDNQLRGRSGRQGDPGSSRFYLALEDSMMKAFGTDKMSSMMDRFGYEEGVPLEHPWLSKAIENAQKKLEGYHFGIRKNLKEYDDVLNQQREIFYGIRRKVLEGEGTKELVLEAIENIVAEAVEGTCSDRKGVEEWDLAGIKEMLMKVFDEPPSLDTSSLGKFPTDTFRERIAAVYKDSYQEREDAIGAELLRRLEREVLLKVMDRLWMDHLSAMDHLRDSVRLRGIGQRNPLLEYKREGYNMFQVMYALRDEEVLSQLFHIRKLSEEQVQALEAARKRQAMEQLQTMGRRPTQPGPAGAPGPQPGGPAIQPGARPPQGQQITLRLPGGIPPELMQQLNSMPPEEARKILFRLNLHQNQLRNNPCWCGSGKKYKKCHMDTDLAELGPPPEVPEGMGEAQEASPAPEAPVAPPPAAPIGEVVDAVFDDDGQAPAASEAPPAESTDDADDEPSDGPLIMGDPLRRG